MNQIIYSIVKIPSQNLQFVERRNENPTTELSDLVVLKDYFDIKRARSKITIDAQAVSTDLDEKLNSYN